MIKEKMLELLVLNEILQGISDVTRTIKIGEKEYNPQKLLERTKVLLEEFLEPYVIESDSKE